MQLQKERNCLTLQSLRGLNNIIRKMLKLRIVSPEKIVYDGDAESVKVPGTLGSFEILNDHAPIISSLTKGLVEYVTTKGKQCLNVRSGFVEVKKNQVSLCIEVVNEK